MWDLNNNKKNIDKCVSLKQQQPEKPHHTPVPQPEHKIKPHHACILGRLNTVCFYRRWLSVVRVYFVPMAHWGISQFLRFYYFIEYRVDMSMQNKNKYFTISVCLYECALYLWLKAWKKMKKKKEKNRTRIQFGYQNAHDGVISYAYAFFSLIFLRDIKCTSFNVNVSKLKLLCGASEKKNLIMEITSYIGPWNSRQPENSKISFWRRAKKRRSRCFGYIGNSRVCLMIISINSQYQ